MVLCNMEYCTKIFWNIGEKKMRKEEKYDIFGTGI